MAIIKNIGVLNVVNIKEELASKITELRDIGLLVESDNSQILLKNSKKINIGSSIKIPSDFKVDYILKNGFMEIDQDFLEGLTTPVVLLINGKTIFHNGIDSKLLDEKLYKIVINGYLICPNRLKGVIESRSVINGKTIGFKNDFRYIDGNVRMNNRFLKGLRSDSKLAFNKLMIIDDIDMELFEKKIDKIQVLEKLVLSEKYEDILSYIEDSYNINTIFIPGSDSEIKYFSDSIIIDDNTIGNFNKNVIYVEGEVEVYLNDNIQIDEHISYLVCDKVICDEKVYSSIKNSLGEEVKVQIIKARLIKNTTKMELSSELLEKITIKNMGKLIISESINIDNFKKNVASILNYGVIEAPIDILGLVESKVTENFGRIRALKEIVEIKQEEDNEDILYANMGELKL